MPHGRIGRSSPGRLLGTALWLAVAAAGDATSAPAHPLDPLSAEEITAAAEVLRAAGLADAATRYAALELLEPPKSAVLAWRAGHPSGRAARAAMLRADGLHEAEVDLAARRVLAFRRVEGAQPDLLAEEYALATRLTLADPGWQAAMRRRGYTGLDGLLCDPLTAGHFGAPEERGRRLLRVACYDAAGTRTTVYGRPVEGLVAVVDLGRREVVRVVDTGAVPVPPGPNRVDEASRRDLQPAMRPVLLRTPLGGNARFDGHEVAWDRWRFHLRLDKRVGTVVSLLRWEAEGGAARMVLYQGHASEVFVPYMDDAEAWYFRTYMDIGEYGFGALASALRAGTDCPADAAFLDATLADAEGRPARVERALCVFERATGSPGWRHAEWYDGSYEGRPEVELVVRSIATVGNYDYVVDWVLTRHGEIRADVGVTGMAAVKGVRARSMADPTAAADTATGALVAPGAVAVHHDHFVSLRLDLDVDGPTNSFVRERLVRRAGTGRTPRRSLWGVEAVPMPTEGPVRPGHGGGPEVWRVVNPEARAALGHQPGYEIVAGHSAVSLLDPEDWPQRRAAFSGAPLWVTAHDAAERHATGAYPNQSPGGEGLPRFVARGRPIERGDVVVWYTMGFHHVTRPEDWPVLPTTWHRLRLRPHGFFSENPAVTVRRGFADTP